MITQEITRGKRQMDHNRTFGQWVLKYREDKRIGLRTIARSAKLNASTISRIERGIIDPTLMTAVRIVRAIGARPEDFYSFLSGSSRDDPIRPVDVDTQVVTLEDVMGFEMLATISPMSEERILADKLNQIQNKLKQDSNSPNTAPYTFNSNDVIPLISGSLLYEMNPQYPTSIKASSILDIYSKGGLILRLDAIALIRQQYAKQRDKGLQIKMGSEEAKISTIVNSSLEKEKGRKIKLSELIRVDNVLADEGEILIISWKAVEFEQEAKLNPPPSINLQDPLLSWWNLQCMKYGYMLIVISRWIEALDLSDSRWLDEIRSQTDFDVKEE
jgi:transcriptional regulator with XRE-family HTH domain